MQGWLRLLSIVAVLSAVCALPAAAATVMVLSDSAGVYLVDTSTGAVVQSYGALFTGSNSQDLAQDLSGNLYVTTSSGNLEKSTFNPNALSASTAYASAVTVGPIAGITTAVPRLSFDPTTTYCASGCLVTMNSAGSAVDWVNPTNGTTIKSLTVSPSISGGGDIAVVPTGASSENLYLVSGKVFYKINASTGASTTIATFAWSGLTGSLTGLAMIANGNLVACEQKGSGTPWTLWEFSTAGTLVGSHTGIATGSDVVNDLASVPGMFSSAKTGTANAGPGDTLIYALTLQNTGYFTYPTGAIRDPVPANVSISTSSPPSCAVSGGGSCAITSAAGAQTVVATVSSLAPSATAKLTIVGSPTSSSGTAVNTGYSSVPFDPSEYGGATLTTNSVTTTFTGSEFAKQVTNITEGIGPGTALIGKPGDVIEYTLTFTNLRGFALQNFAINDPVPANTSYVAASATCVTTPSPLSCAPSQAGGIVTFTYSGGSLATNGAVVAKFRVTIN